MFALEKSYKSIQVIIMDFIEGNKVSGLKTRKFSLDFSRDSPWQYNNTNKKHKLMATKRNKLCKLASFLFLAVCSDEVKCWCQMIEPWTCYTVILYRGS